MNTSQEFIQPQKEGIHRRNMKASERFLSSWRHDRSGYRVKINVSGQRFSAKLTSLQKYPDTLLGSQLLVLFYDQGKDEYFFDRDPELFRFILNFYRIGKLHVSDIDCLEAFRDEMDYFGIPHSAVDECCWNNFNKARNSPNEVSIEKNVLERSYRINERTVHRKTKISKTESVGNNCCKKPFENENNENCKSDKNVQVLYTRKSTRNTDRTKNAFFPLRQTFIHSQIKDGRNICRAYEVKNILQYFYGLLILASTVCNAVETVDCRTQIKCGDYYSRIFFAMEIFFVAVFTADYVIRFILAKQKCVFVREFLNIVDLISILPFYFELVFKFLIGASDVMITFRILRVLRLMKLNRNSPRLQAFIQTLRNCMSDLLFLYFMFAFGILLFGGVIYYIEKDSTNAGNFTSIPHSLWFTCVTMVTTGYGDVIPVTVLGKLFAALCGFCGVLVMSLPIPIMQDKKANIGAQT